MKPSTRVEWTTQEEALLAKLWAAGYSPRRIQPFIPRHTAEAIKQRRMKMKLPSRFSRRCWTIGQRQMVFEATDRLILQMAERTGRTPAAIRNVVSEALMSFSGRQKLAA